MTPVEEYVLVVTVADELAVETPVVALVVGVSPPAKTVVFGFFGSIKTEFCVGPKISSVGKTSSTGRKAGSVDEAGVVLISPSVLAVF